MRWTMGSNDGDPGADRPMHDGMNKGLKGHPEPFSCLPQPGIEPNEVVNV